MQFWRSANPWPLATGLLSKKLFPDPVAMIVSRHSETSSVVSSGMEPLANQISPVDPQLKVL